MDNVTIPTSQTHMAVELGLEMARKQDVTLASSYTYGSQSGFAPPQSLTSSSTKEVELRLCNCT